MEVKRSCDLPGLDDGGRGWEFINRQSTEIFQAGKNT